jgi:hypothetical protein
MSASSNEKPVENLTKTEAPAENTTAGADKERTFTVFPKLPPELQRKVWRHAAQEVEPRLITFAPSGGQIPGILRACHLSRSIAEKNYSFLEDRVAYEDRFIMPINYDIDIVFLREDNDVWAVRNGPPGCHDWLTHIKRLAISRLSDVDFYCNLPLEPSET